MLESSHFFSADTNYIKERLKGFCIASSLRVFPFPLKHRLPLFDFNPIMAYFYFELFIPYYTNIKKFMKEVKFLHFFLLLKKTIPN
jgi:hypothetical protein